MRSLVDGSQQRKMRRPGRRPGRRPSVPTRWLTVVVASALLASFVTAVAPAPSSPFVTRKAPGFRRTSATASFVTQFPGFAPADISCTAGYSYLGTICAEVGNTANGSPVALSGTTVSGGAEGWFPSSVPSGSYTLTGVSCMSHGSCVAVGGTASGPEVLTSTMGYPWTWTAVTGSSLPSSAGPLDAVACAPQTTDCVASGVDSSSDPVIFASTNGGASWSTVWSLGSAFAGDTFPSISCLTVSSTPHCYAAGGWVAGQSSATPVIVGSDNATSSGTWYAATLPSNLAYPASSISCVEGSTGGDDCWSTGMQYLYSPPTPDVEVLIEMLNGTPSGTWSIGSNYIYPTNNCCVAVGPFNEAGVSMSRIACVNYDYCWANGDDATSAPTIWNTTDAENSSGPGWAEEAWSSSSSQDFVPQEDDMGLESAISCVQPQATSSPVSCWIATTGGIIATIDGGATWSQQTYNPGDPTAQDDTPWIPGDRASGPSSVTCPTATTCFATDNGIVIKTDDGGETWLPVPDRQLVQTVQAHADVAYVMNAISCASVLVCVATATQVGFDRVYWPNCGNFPCTSQLADVLTTTDGGVTWKNLTPYYGFNVGDWYGFSSVSCPTTTACWVDGQVAGNYDAPGDWEVAQVTPGPSGTVSNATAVSGTSPSLGSLSCTDANDCWVVDEGDGVIDSFTLAGSTVTVTQDSGVPTGASINQLSCVTDGTNDCFAGIGYTTTSNGTTTEAGELLANGGGTSWSSVWTTTQGSLSSADVVGAACTGSASNCIAIGDSYTSGSSPQPTTSYTVAEQSGAWGSPSSLPTNNYGQTEGLLTSIACGPDLSSCFAVGEASTDELSLPANDTLPALIISTDGLTANPLGITNIWETYGGFNPAEPCLSCLAAKLGLSPFAFGGDPVDTATGAFQGTFTPLSIPNRDLPLDISFTYDSSLAQNQRAQNVSPGPLGYGWSDNFDVSLVCDISGGCPSSTYANGVVEVHQASGAVAVFGFPRQEQTQQGTVYVYMPLTPHATASLAYDPTYNMYSFGLGDNRMSYTFLVASGQTTGDLATVSDPNGNSISMTNAGHTLGCPVSQSTATTCTVSDSNGQALSLQYSSSGTLSSVADQAGRTASFNVSAGVLTSFTDPANQTTGTPTDFCYDSANPNTNFQADLTEIIPPNATGTENCTTANPTDVLVNSYDATTGKVTQQTDYRGNKTNFSYVGDPLSADGGQTQMTDPNGNETTFVYAGGKRIATIYDANGGGPSAPASPTEWIYTYDDTTASGQSCYGNSLSLPTGIIDPDGNVTTLCYDDQGDMTSKTTPATAQHPNGDTSTYDYVDTPSGGGQDCYGQTFGKPTTVVDPANQGNYGGGANPGYSYTYCYDSTGNEICATAPNSHGDTCANYNQSGYSTAYTSTFSYANGDMVCMTRPNTAGDTCASPGSGASTTTNAYDGSGDLTSSTNGDGDQTTYTYTCSGGTGCYSNVGLLYAKVLPNGNVSGGPPASDFETTYTYDADGRVTSTTTASGTTQAPVTETSTDSYDANGDQICSTAANPAGDTCGNYNQTGYTTAYTTTYAYDFDGNEICKTPGNSSGYTCVGYTPTTANSSPDTTTYGYDGNGNQSCWTIPNPTIVNTSSSYNCQSDPTTASNPYATISSYDGRDNLAQSVGPLTSQNVNATTTYAYNAENSKTCETVANPYGYTCAGPWTSYSIAYSNDQDQELTQITYGDGTPDVADIVYDADGMRLSSDDGTGVTSYTYNPRGEVTSLTDGHGDTLTFGYDGAGNRTCVGYPNTAGNTCSSPGTGNGIVNYTYDGTGLMTSMTTWLSSDTTSFSYDADSNLTQITYPSSTNGGSGNPSNTTYAYDDTNTPIGESYQAPALGNANTPWAVTNVSDTANPNELINQETDTVTGQSNQVATFTYNGRNQETQAGGSNYGYNDTFSYDGAGRLTSANFGLFGWNYTVDNASETTQIGVAGNGAKYFSYNCQGDRLTAGSSTGTQSNCDASPVNCPSTTTTCYTWSINGTMTSAYEPGATAATTYTYNGDGLRMSMTLPGSSTTYFTYDTSGSTPLLMCDGTNDYVYGPGNTPIEAVAISAQTPNYYLIDDQGSFYMAIDASGGYVGEETYGPYGNFVPYGTAPNFGYVGGYIEPNGPSGLEYLINRYYDPRLAEFVSPDPLTALTGQPYAYAGGSPVNFTDPSGLNPGCPKQLPGNEQGPCVRTSNNGRGSSSKGHRQTGKGCGCSNGERGIAAVNGCVVGVIVGGILSMGIAFFTFGLGAPAAPAVIGGSMGVGCGLGAAGAAASCQPNPEFPQGPPSFNEGAGSKSPPAYY